MMIFFQNFQIIELQNHSFLDLHSESASFSQSISSKCFFQILIRIFIFLNI